MTQIPMLIFTMMSLCLTHNILRQISSKEILRIFLRTPFLSYIRSISKKLEFFSELYSKLNHIFSVICFSETWASEGNISKDSTFQLKNYSVVHQVRNFRK